MTRLDALRALESSVNSGQFIPALNSHAGAFPPSTPYGRENFHMSFDAFNGSLNAAKALHEAVLPGWEWQITHRGHVQMTGPEYPYSGLGSVEANARGGGPARSWLLAQIRALIAIEEADNDR